MYRTNSRFGSPEAKKNDNKKYHNDLGVIRRGESHRFGKRYAAALIDDSEGAHARRTDQLALTRSYYFFCYRFLWGPVVVVKHVHQVRDECVVTFFFFFSHFHFPASGQAVVTGVVPFSPRFFPSTFIAHRVQQFHCSSIFHRVLLTHALALSASQFVHKKKSQRI